MSVSGQWEFDIAAPPTFDMEDLARLRANALVRCSGPDFNYALTKLVPLLVTRNCYSVFLLALSMLEFSKHVIAQVETLEPGQIFAQESSVSISEPFSVADVLDLLERKRKGLSTLRARQEEEVTGMELNDRERVIKEMVVSGVMQFTGGLLGELIEDIRTAAGFPPPDLITSAEN